MLYEGSLLRFLGFIPVTAGVFVWVCSVWHFVVFGRGTPAPVTPPVKLVNGGIYRYARNTMYLGVLLILLGEAILLQSLTLYFYTVLVWLAFHLFVVFYEEPRLKKIFNNSYMEYRASVPRWIPRPNTYCSAGKRTYRQEH